MKIEFLDPIIVYLDFQPPLASRVYRLDMLSTISWIKKKIMLLLKTNIYFLINWILENNIFILIYK